MNGANVYYGSSVQNISVLEANAKCDPIEGRRDDRLLFSTLTSLRFDGARVAS